MKEATNRRNETPATSREIGFGQKILISFRRRIVAGIITIIPISVTIFILYFIIKKIHQLFAPIVTKFLYIDVPVLSGVVPVVVSVFLAVGLIYFVGLLSATYTIRRLINYGERLVAKMPFIKTLYATSKQIVDAVTLPQKGAFKKVVAVEFPRKGMYALAFVTSEMEDKNSGERRVSIFLPTAPNVTTGFALLLPVDQLYDVNVTISEGFKWIISGGIVSQEKFELTPYKSLLAESQTKTT